MNFRTSVYYLLFALAGATQPALADDVLVDGLAWRQLTDTAGAGLSWNDVASVCPLDETPCQGSVNGVDFTGWIWASRERVEQLFYTLMGWSIGDIGSFSGSPVELFFDNFDPVLESSSVQLTHGIFSLPAAPADGMVESVFLIDARVSAGSDKIDVNLIDVAATEGSGTFFGLQPLGVFLVRDPQLELCSNGIDDDGDGLADIEDDDCSAINPVIAGREWRQLSVTQGLAFWDVANICPYGGTPCSGSIGNVDFDGWTWASGLDVADMLYALTGWPVGYGNSLFSDIPGIETIAPKVFVAFNPTWATATKNHLAGLTYDSLGEHPPHFYPDVGIYQDPLTCFNGIDDNGNGVIDFPADGACGLPRLFFVTDTFENTPFQDGMGASTGSLNFPAMSNPYYGYFLYREPLLATHESCDNTFDDDGDGLIDELDPDCVTFEPPVDLLVRCIHEPLWPEEGEEVTIHAEAIDGDGAAIVADRVEIYVSDPDNPSAVTPHYTETQISTVPTGARFSYECKAELGAVTASSGRRDVDIGMPEITKWRGVPVIYNGPTKNKIDIVFIPDVEYAVDTDANDRFDSDIYQVIKEGLYGIPWFVRHQRDINFWLGRDYGTVTPSDPNNANKRCKKDKPDGFNNGYPFADAAGIIHNRECRDNASFKVFTTKFDSANLQVVAHEIGHAAFSLADEYQGGPSLYFTLPDFPNLFPSERSCRNAADRRGKDRDACRYLSDAKGLFLLDARWIFEPDYRATSPPTPDLMQQAGSAACSAGSSCAQYRVGPSEIDRMNWKLGKCRAGRC